MAPTGATRVAGVIGDPIRHSLSPVLHNAAFDACGLDWVYVAFPVAAGDTARALDGMRALGLVGLSVTMPHKAAVAALVDRCSPAATTLRAVNCVVREGADLVGHNTDGGGFLTGLRADTGFDPAGRRVVVFGAGGAARAVVAAVTDAGAAELVVVNRDPDRAADAVSLARGTGRVVDPTAAAGVVEAADLVVNATPVGMGGDPGIPLDPARLHDGQVVVDLVYDPLETPLLRAARERGATATNGLSMLVHQAALAFELWTAQRAPVDAMAAAVRTHLVATAAGGQPSQ